MKAGRSSILSTALILALVLTDSRAQEGKTKSADRRLQSEDRTADENEFLRLNAEVIRKLTAYRESLENLLSIYERSVEKLAGEIESRRSLVQRGYVSRLELEESERALADAGAKVQETRREIAEAETAITEAEARAELVRLPPLANGGYGETRSLIRFNGSASWSLADAARIEKFFVANLGRLLPLSAVGQTALHERMRLDHTNAMDVAVHPDSSEGRVLMDHLRKAGIPFVAFRGRVSGSATGAHIHIGKPSLRLASP
jgi:hypothetical protein